MKKATIEISVRVIVIITIAVVVLSLFLIFFRTEFETATTKFEENINVHAQKPTAEIYLAPYSDNNEYVMNQEIIVDGSRSFDRANRITGYYWDTDGDGEVDEFGENKIILNYTDPGIYEITLKVLNDIGGLGETSVKITVYSSNEKNMSKYEGVMFFAKEKTNNQPNLLSMIPITNWVDRNGEHAYPHVIYKGGVGSITEGDIQNMLTQETKTKAIVMDEDIIDLPESPIISHLDSLKEYFDYWIRYDTVVLVDKSELDTVGVKAALYASNLNAPLVFVDGSENNLKKFLNQTTLHIISDHDTLEVDIQTFIGSLTIPETKIINDYSPTTNLRSDIVIT